VLPVFELMARIGSVSPDEMLRATNMGIGMIAVIRPESLDAFRAAVQSDQFVIGDIVEGEPGVTYR
jgi:phosphoribosylformylglycinamidine cyclo-ligase